MLVDPQTLRASLQKLGDDGRIRGWINQAIEGPKRAEMKDFVMQLGRLSLYYWRPDFTPEQAKLMFQDFASDLAGVTPLELEEACQQYRRDPENRFYPTPGQLLELVEYRTKQRAREKFAAQRLLEMLNNAPAADTAPKKLRTIAEILASKAKEQAA